MNRIIRLSLFLCFLSGFSLAFGQPASFPFGITAFATIPGSHTTLTLDAKALATLRMDEVVWPSQEVALRAASTMVHEATPWNRLAGWKIGPGNQVASIPSTMGGFQEARLSLVGFMFPLTGGEKTREFLLLPSIDVCCYGPRPPLNQLVRVEISVPVGFERILPVVVEGIFHFDPHPESGYIYRLTADRFEVLPPDPTLVRANVPLVTHPFASIEVEGGNPAASSGSSLPAIGQDLRVAAGGPTTHTPGRFPRGQDEAAVPYWQALAELGTAVPDGEGKTPIPAFLGGEVGKRIRLRGFLSGAFQDAKGQRRLMIGRDFWDSCCTGVPPTPFSSVLAQLTASSPMPPIWAESVTVEGRLAVRPRHEWVRFGVLWLLEAAVLEHSEAGSQAPHAHDPHGH